ncbi:MAG: SDR family NAD(P)-dependent oxidoreductase, partial [Lentisphaeria bacterium]|nr:SDR family NAD(P)-dependent oxidoreductase [Lentisphaeria bacterium]
MAADEKILALVTGAAQGIGQATTARLLQDGCRVIALDRNEDTLQDLQAELGDDVLPVSFDLSDCEAIGP